MNETWQQYPWYHREGIINGINLHWVEAVAGGHNSQNNNKGLDSLGHPSQKQQQQQQRPIVILLHGFPEFWYTWRNQIPILKQEGYRVIAPDLRGYNLSAKPKSGFDIDTLTTDIYELIQHVATTSTSNSNSSESAQCEHKPTKTNHQTIKKGKKVEMMKVNIVGHDCGAVIAWEFAARYPKHVNKLVILNAPPIQSLVSYFESSWVMSLLWFVPHGFTEYIGGFNHSYLISQYIKHFSKNKSWICSSNNGNNNEQRDHNDKSNEQQRTTSNIVDLYRDSISRNGSLHCMLEYYRNIYISLKQCEHTSTASSILNVPTLVLWGEYDTAFGPADKLLGNQLENYFSLSSSSSETKFKLVLLPDSGHFIHEEIPNEVNHHLLLFLNE